MPEQFGTFSYFDVGNTAGGHITQLYSYYNNLIVFRESSIDIIRQTASGLTLSQLSPEVGTEASNSIALVPEIGVIFLTRDGFYAVSGGLDGGSSVQILKMSKLIGKEVELISETALAKATAAYSSKEKEYWCHYTRKGHTTPTRGVVFHQLTKAWSFRGAVNKADEYKWQFSVITTDAAGNFLLGTQPTWLLSGSESTSTTQNARGTLVGPQVWSGAPYWGYTYIAGASAATTAYTATEAPLMQNIYQSAWIDFGDPAIKHRVTSVELEMVAYGDNPITLEWGADYDSEWRSGGTQKATKPELAFTSSADAVLGNTALTKSPFKIGESIIKGQRVVVIRWDVVTGLVDNFRFRLIADGHPLHLIGFSVLYNSAAQKPLNQRIRSKSGQPR